jgi:hypothetical protein
MIYSVSAYTVSCIVQVVSNQRLSSTAARASSAWALLGGGCRNSSLFLEKVILSARRVIVQLTERTKSFIIGLLAQPDSCTWLSYSAMPD